MQCSYNLTERKKTNIDINDVIVEYVDKVSCAYGKVYTNSLVLCNNDYSISLIMFFEIMRVLYKLQLDQVINEFLSTSILQTIYTHNI